MDVLVVCTANACRSPMAAALLGASLGERGATGTVRSAGTRAVSGARPTRDAIEAMARQGLDISAHRATTLTPSMLGHPDLVITMSPRQSREVIVCAPSLWTRTFTLPELVRRARAVGPRAEQAWAPWIELVHGDRQRGDLLHDSRAGVVVDPTGRGRDAHDATVAELRSLIDDLVELSFSRSPTLVVPPFGTR